MSPELSMSVHFWRGIGTDAQLSLFYIAVRLGFFTISFSREWMLQRYRQNRIAMEERVEWDRAHGWPSRSAKGAGA